LKSQKTTVGYLGIGFFTNGNVGTELFLSFKLRFEGAVSNSMSMFEMLLLGSVERLIGGGCGGHDGAFPPNWLTCFLPQKTRL